MDRGRSLSRREFDDVIRRATELAAGETEADSELTEDELYRIAREVGVPERHVRKALVELRTGALAPEAAPGGPLERVFGPEVVRAARVVPGDARSLARTIDEFMVGGQLLQPLRKGERFLQYRPAVDWISQIARAASSTSRRYYVASAKRVEVRIDPLPDEEGRCLVELEVEPGFRGEYLVGAGVGAVMGGGGAGFGLGVLLMALFNVMTVAVALGLTGAVAVGAAIVAGTGYYHRKKSAEVSQEVEGILDRLEMGEDLEPPPPSWRRWVERQFHGARKLMGDGGDDTDPFGM